MSTVIGNNWLNQNQFRDYPFLPQIEPRDIPHGLIVDCNLAVQAQNSTAWLSKVERLGGVIYYTFHTNATDTPLVFSRALGDPEYKTTWVDSAGPSGCTVRPDWFGFLTTGQMSVAAALLPNDGDLLELDDGAWSLEPSTVKCVDPGGVASINLANYDRSYTNTAPGCDGEDYPEIPTSNQLVVGQICISGDVEFTEGYGTAIQQSAVDGRLTFVAQLGEGAGTPCDEISLIPDQEPLPNSPYLSGGPSCLELLRSINGVPGPHVQLIGKRGVEVYQHATNVNTLVIDFSGRNSADCATAGGTTNYESSSSFGI